MIAALMPLFARAAAPAAAPGLAGGLIASPGWLIGVLAVALVAGVGAAVGWWRRGKGDTKR